MQCGTFNHQHIRYWANLPVDAPITLRILRLILSTFFAAPYQSVFAASIEVWKCKEIQRVAVSSELAALLVYLSYPLNFLCVVPTLLLKDPKQALLNSQCT